MACGEKCFTFTWKLENASYCVQKKGEAILSPAFIVDSIEKTKWKIGIFPRGYTNGNYISFCLSRAAYSKGPAEVEICFDLAFIAEDSSVLISSAKTKYAFSKSQSHGSHEFVKRVDVFVSHRLTYLPQDTLTVRCRIWKSIGQMSEDVCCLARSRIGVQKRSFLWNVRKFSTLELEENLTNHIKLIENDTTLMSLYLSLTGGISSEENISFELSLQDKTIKFSTFRLSLVNSAGNKVLCNQDEIWFEDPSKSKEFKFFYTKNQLMAMKYSYLPDDVLSLHWEWTFSEGVISEKIEVVDYARTDFGGEICSIQNAYDKKMVPLSRSLKENLKSLYDENFLCDIKLKTSTHTFNAHKIILSASSSVFKAMFSSDMKIVIDIVNIEDLNDDTVSRMLLYMYTTHVEDLTWGSASDLYKTADIYAIQNLKNICSSYLKNNLSHSNACQALLLSDSHSDSDFKSSVQNYILSNIKGIVNSDEWKQLMKSSPKMVAETLSLQYK